MNITIFLVESKIIIKPRERLSDTDEPPFLGPFTLHGTLLLLISLLIPFGIYFLIVGESFSTYAWVPAIGFVLCFIMGAIIMHKYVNRRRRKKEEKRRKLR